MPVPPQAAVEVRMRTPRLELVAATVSHLDAELKGRDSLEQLLGAAVPDSWPPSEYDRDAVLFFRKRLLAGGAAAVGWYGWYALARTSGSGRQDLIGTGGYLGPPNDRGTVEIGYSIVREHRRNGYASELAASLVRRALETPAVTEIVAHTTPENIGSIRVLTASGFVAAGPGRDPGTVKYRLARG